ncbi:octicosapeptide/Phox/Bem1p [Striga asiatica]|uniref:Octicosapeptide/Phox/Bem1p n=1 Tax=Striga asiatica TaxID=4170 RepID=A0A5A7P600_STRAF|nr:octicosapeptide/Phox/Bem1p [Striga asiatica]
MEKQSSGLINGGATKVKLLCSYGGRIQSRPNHHHLSYVGGDTKILAVDRDIKFSEIAAKLNSICEKSEISIKYQLPGEDLYALISLIDDDDVEQMMVEYDRLQGITAKPARLRLFVFDVSAQPVKSVAVKSSGPVMPSNPDYLFGFDKEYEPSVGPPLDLLQIPGIIMPDNFGLVQCGGAEGKIGKTWGHVSGDANNGSVNGAAAAAPQAVYRLPTVVNGGIYQGGPYAYGILPETGKGNREQPVYNFIPVMPLLPEQMTMFSMENNLE